MRIMLVMAASLGLSACGGGGTGSATPGDLAATACNEAAAARLDGKLYEMDLVALAGSMKDVANGEKFLTAPIVIEPGLTSEAKQIVECTVRFSEGKDAPDVVGFVFNW